MTAPQQWLPFWTSGWLWMVLAALLPYIYRYLQRCATSLSERAFFVVDIYHSDESFECIARWLAQQTAAVGGDSVAARVVAQTQCSNEQAQRLHAQTSNESWSDGAYQCMSERDRCGRSPAPLRGSGTQLIFLPAAFTTHMLWHERMPLWFSFEIDEAISRLCAQTSGSSCAAAASSGHVAFGVDARRLRLTVPRTHMRQLRQLLVDVTEADRQARCHERLLTVWVAEGSFWRKTLDRPARPVESVVLRQGLLERLTADISAFFASEQRYRRLGVPFRRGYLLHGPPGNGKSSLVEALAGLFDLQLCVLSLHNRSIDDAALTKLFLSLPSRAAVLIEDVDVAFLRRCVQRSDGSTTTHQTGDIMSVEQRGGACAVTLSGLLNALDGLLAPVDGRLLFMTTNYRCRLDEALLRCGRLDVQVLVEAPDASQISTLVQRFLAPSAPHDDSIACSETDTNEFLCFAQRIVETAQKANVTLNMSLLQEFLLVQCAQSISLDRETLQSLSLNRLIDLCRQQQRAAVREDYVGR